MSENKDFIGDPMPTSNNWVRCEVWAGITNKPILCCLSILMATGHLCDLWPKKREYENFADLC